MGLSPLARSRTVEIDILGVDPMLHSSMDQFGLIAITPSLESLAELIRLFDEENRAWQDRMDRRADYVRNFSVSLHCSKRGRSALNFVDRFSDKHLQVRPTNSSSFTPNTSSLVEVCCLYTPDPTTHPRSTKWLQTGSFASPQRVSNLPASLLSCSTQVVVIKRMIISTRS